MASIGQLIAGAHAASTPRPAVVSATGPEPRPHRVTVCYLTFAELVVMADDAREAEAAAKERLAEARRTFRTAPYVSRVEVAAGRDPETGENRWRECARES